MNTDPLTDIPAPAASRSGRRSGPSWRQRSTGDGAGFADALRSATRARSGPDLDQPPAAGPRPGPARAREAMAGATERSADTDRQAPRPENGPSDPSTDRDIDRRVESDQGRHGEPRPDGDRAADGRAEQPHDDGRVSDGEGDSASADHTHRVTTDGGDEGAVDVEPIALVPPNSGVEVEGEVGQTRRTVDEPEMTDPFEPTLEVEAPAPLESAETVETGSRPDSGAVDSSAPEIEVAEVEDRLALPAARTESAATPVEGTTDGGDEAATAPAPSERPSSEGAAARRSAGRPTAAVPAGEGPRTISGGDAAAAPAAGDTGAEVEAPSPDPSGQGSKSQPGGRIAVGPPSTSAITAADVRAEPTAHGEPGIAPLAGGEAATGAGRPAPNEGLSPASQRPNPEVGPIDALRAEGETDGVDEPVWRQVRRALGALRSTSAGEQQFTVRLRPAELGSVTVRISTGDNGVAIALVTESGAAASQLQQQRQQLADELSRGGLAGTTVDIGTRDGQAGGDPSGRADGDRAGSGPGEPGGRAEPGAEGSTARSPRRRQRGLVDLDL